MSNISSYNLSNEDNCRYEKLATRFMAPGLKQEGEVVEYKETSCTVIFIIHLQLSVYRYYMCLLSGKELFTDADVMEPWMESRPKYESQK